MLRRLLLFCFAFTSCLAGAQSAPTLLKSADLQADAAILRRVYEQLHPGLYRYNTKPQMDAHFADLSQALDHDQTLAEAFLAFSRFAATVRCGHTQANPVNQSKAVTEALFNSSTRVPFLFVWLDHRMIVTSDLTPSKDLPPGTEILSMDSVPVATILDRLLPFARADGANDAKRIAQLGVLGTESYELFDIYFPLVFPPTGTTLTLRARKPGAPDTQSITVATLTVEQRARATKGSDTEDPNAPLFSSKNLPNGSAYLRMPTWALFNSHWAWKPWLDAHLDEAAARNAPALILDLRGNEGGDDVGAVILAHLVDHPLTLAPMQRLVRYRDVPADLAPFLDTWDKSFFHWSTAAVELPTPWPTAPAQVSYLKLQRPGENTLGDTVQPQGKRFRGRVFVLIDANNSSATFQFAQNMQTLHLGTLVGQPTGGSQRGINGGAFFFVHLPHSGLEFDLPLIGTFPPVPAPNAGITPDIRVQPTPQDIATGRDAALAALPVR